MVFYPPPPSLSFTPADSHALLFFFFFFFFFFGSNIEVYTPFAPTELRDDLVDKTYLDTTGRPTISIKKVRCTEKHAEDIYVSLAFLFLFDIKNKKRMRNVD
jgi:hypothetical protein